MPRTGIYSLAMMWLALGPIAAVAQEPAPPWEVSPTPLGIDGFERMIDERHPRLARAALAVEVARGQADQAGQRLNPVFTFSADELFDRTGPGGILTPFLSQEIRTRGKRRLDHAAALREVDQVTMAYFIERLALLTAVRQAYFDVLEVQQRIAQLKELEEGARVNAEDARRGEARGQVSKLDRVRTEAAWEALRAAREAAERERPAMFRRLAALAGCPDLPEAPLAGSLDLPPPEYTLEALAAHVRSAHPQIMSARLAVDRARLLLQRAQAERTPNITIGAGYTRQSQNQSNDVSLSVSFPVPLWNRNQGAIRAARAELGSAELGPARVETELLERLAAAFAEYTAARYRTERFRTEVVPRRREAYELTLQAQRGGQADFFSVLNARSELAEALTSSLRDAAQAWKSAAELASMMLDDAPSPRP